MLYLQLPNQPMYAYSSNTFKQTLNKKGLNTVIKQNTTYFSEKIRQILYPYKVTLLNVYYKPLCVLSIQTDLVIAGSK